MGEPEPRSIVDKVRRHIDKVLIAASGIAVLVAGWVSWDYRSHTNCQVELLEANRATTHQFRESLQVLLAQPPRPVEERRRAFVKLQDALRQQEDIQERVGNCQ